MRILVISHAEHYYDDAGNIVGFGPLVKELDYLATHSIQIIHIACLYKDRKAPSIALPYKRGNIRFVPIPPYGGAGLKNKLSIITASFSIIRAITRELKNADIFQFRAPTSMGLYVIPFLTWFTKKRGWYKYAGNWVQKNPPLSYLLQKQFLLKMQSRPITINGKWPGQPAKCMTFENPCLNQNDRLNGADTVSLKNYNAPFIMCFVGRLEGAKGVGRIFDALGDKHARQSISKFHIVGEGPFRSELEILAKSLSFEVIFHGSLSQNEVFEVYKQSHFLIFPSNSEGFPKVVAEACNFGCIPIVSDVSSISQYITPDVGFLWRPTEGSFTTFFNSMDLKDADLLKQKARSAYEIAGKFTMEKYLDRLNEKILMNV
ncbi:MAG: glycosyltransferase [Mucilaginibacter sp.]